MSPTFAYAASCLALVLAGTAATWPLLDGAGRNAVLAAALLALPIQIASFAALVARHGRTEGFLTAWLGGVVARVGAVVLGALVVTWTDVPPAPALLSLAGFFLVMLLLEPVFLGRGTVRLPASR